MNASKTIPVVPKKLIIPFILLTSLFALWGFANAVTDPMVQAFKKVYVNWWKSGRTDVTKEVLFEEVFGFSIDSF